MDDLREKLANLTSVDAPIVGQSDDPVVLLYFTDAVKAAAFGDFITEAKDAAMNQAPASAIYGDVDVAMTEYKRSFPIADPDAPTVQTFGSLGRINEEALDDTRAYDAEIDAPIKPSDLPSPLDTDAQAWASSFMDTACYNNPLGRALRQFPHGDRTELGEIMVGWFANAIMAGYDAGRPLDPGTIYIDQTPTREQERVAAGLSSDFTSPRAETINPVEDAIMPELRESLYDETAAIAEAAGEGMGVACEKPE